MGGLDRVDADDPSAIERVVAVLRAGGTVLLPTDTVYGIAASPQVPGATDQLFALKGRAADHPCAVLVADADQARSLVSWPGDGATRLIGAQWPGPLTVVLRRSAVAQAMALGGDGDTIGVRCPDHDLVRAVARLVGPIATTSANRTGEPTPPDAASAATTLVGAVDLMVDGGPAGTVASTVVDATVRPWRILRQGAARLTDLG